MKILTCRTPSCQGRPVLLPDNRPYALGQPGVLPLMVNCSRCKQATRVTAEEYWRLPDVTLEDARKDIS
ncbi:MAG: hypothetical protein ACR2P5_06040 [Gammaproteobacteria bacterium]